MCIPLIYRKLKIHCSLFASMLQVLLKSSHSQKRYPCKAKQKSSLHIRIAKILSFNHICKFLGRFFSFASKASSSTSRSSSDSQKYGHDNTPIVSASRYTGLNSLPRSCSEDGIDVGRTVRRRHPHPRHSFVRRHHSGPVRSEQQLSMFESICYPL